MDSLRNTYQVLLKERTSRIRRGLLDRMDAGARLIAIKGSRGVGTTNFLLDFAREYHAGDEGCLYVNLNNLFFATEGLFAFVERFHKLGGKVLLLDQVHKYPGGDRELRAAHDAFPSLQVVFTISSIPRVRTNRYLEGSVSMYNLNGLSFREFLTALDEHILLKTLEDASFSSPLSNTAHDRLLYLYKVFLVVGGMPEAVSRFAETKSMLQARMVQQDIIDTLFDDLQQFISPYDRYGRGSCTSQRDTILRSVHIHPETGIRLIRRPALTRHHTISSRG